MTHRCVAIDDTLVFPKISRKAAPALGFTRFSKNRALILLWKLTTERLRRAFRGEPRPCMIRPMDTRGVGMDLWTAPLPTTPHLPPPLPTGVRPTGLTRFACPSLRRGLLRTVDNLRLPTALAPTLAFD